MNIILGRMEQVITLEKVSNSMADRLCLGDCAYGQWRSQKFLEAWAALKDHMM
jgi:hypothetical protein